MAQILYLSQNIEILYAIKLALYKEEFLFLHLSTTWKVEIGL